MHLVLSLIIYGLFSVVVGSYDESAIADDLTPKRSPVMEHVKVYAEQGHVGGWNP